MCLANRDGCVLSTIVVGKERFVEKLAQIIREIFFHQLLISLMSFTARLEALGRSVQIIKVFKI